MLEIRLGNKELKVKYAYIATYKAELITKLVNMSEIENESDQINAIIGLLPEMLLVGLQKYHRDEFGYDFDTLKGKDEALIKVSDLLDEYFDDDDSDFMDLFNQLQSELLENGFLSKLLNQKMEEKPKSK